MRSFDFTDCLKNIRFIEGALDQSWLKRETEKITTYKPPKDLRKLSFLDNELNIFHPLAYLIYKVEKQFKKCAQDKYFEVTEEITKLSLLGESLSLLRDLDISGLDIKIKDLTSKDKKLFEKTSYEIQIAAFYARKRQKVKFVKTESSSGKQTPDLLVKNQVEIECKKNDVLSPRDIKNNNIWKTIITSSSIFMNKYKINYLLFIRTERDPNTKMVEFITTELEKLISKGMEGEFKYKAVYIKLQSLGELDREIEANGFKCDLPEPVDYITQAQETKNLPNGRVYLRNPRFYGFKSAILPDKITRVLEAIKSAATQLSGVRPGLIYVDLNQNDKRMVEDDFKRLDILIKDRLRQNSTITAVVLTSETYSKDQYGIRYKHEFKIMSNTTARFKIPGNFKLDEN